MQFPNIEDDDGDFGVTSATRSRLSSLFQTERTAGGDVNQALTFTAPKQPKKNDNPQSNQNQNQGVLKLIHASVVHAYKLVDGSYTKQGKLGCAILGLHETSTYKVLLYKGKQEKVATCNILPVFQFQVQPNNYATFYDERNENWSINFDTENALLEFAMQIALAKANSQDKSQPSLIIQDLHQGEGQTLDTGDAAEVKYTGWLLTNFTFGQVFDSNMQSDSAFRLRLGKKVIKGWSEGLIGAQKGTTRLLIIPPHLAYGAEGMGNAVPPNSTLIFKLDIIKVKLSRDASHSPSPLKVENLPEKKPEVLPRHSITSEDNIRLRGASISEQLTQSPKKDKAQLISRMAKMGTATLPFQGAVAAHVSSDSEDEEEIQKEKASPPIQLSGSRTSSPKPASRSTSRKNSEQLISAQPIQLHSVQEANPYHGSSQPSPVPFYPQAIVPSQPYTPSAAPFPVFQPQIASQYQLSQYSLQSMPSLVPQMTTGIGDTHLPMLLTETRNQNTELRLSLSKITDKIDTVIHKVDDVRLNQGRSVGLSHTPFMDSAMLVQSIEKIVQENRQLKEDAEAKNTKIQSLNEKIYDLLQRNQRFFEESTNMMEQRTDSLQAASSESNARLLMLEKEKAKLSSELSDVLSKLGNAEVELANHQNQESVLRQKLQEEKGRIEEMDTELRILKKQLESESENSSSSTKGLQAEIKSLLDERHALNSDIRSWETKYSLLDKEFSEKSKQLQALQEHVDKSNTDSKDSSNENKLKIEAMEKEMREIQREKQQAMSNCEDLDRKLSESLKSETILKDKLTELTAELQSTLPWKRKYEVFYQKTLQMKENYENHLQKLEEELKHAQSTTAITGSPDFSGEIKRTMNALYKSLQGQFPSEKSFQGAQVLEITLQTIKKVTVMLLQRKEQLSDTVAKETNSDATSKSNASSLNSDKNENLNEKTSAPENDNASKTVSVVQENGVAGDALLSGELPLDIEAKVSSKEKTTTKENETNNLEEQLSKTKLDENTTECIESLDQSLQNNVDSENIIQSDESRKPAETESPKPVDTESKESVVENKIAEKSKEISRYSPDHLQQLTATNIPDTSNSVTAKVLDGPSDMHAS